MDKKLNSGGRAVRFFPIFLGATLAAFIDTIQAFVDETVVGNLFEDVAFGAINLLEPYLLLVDFVSYLICVGGASLIVRARGAEKPEEMQKIYNHAVTCCLIMGLTFCAIYSCFYEPLVSLVTQGSPAHPFSMQAFYWDRFNVAVTPLYDFLFTYVLYLDGALISSISMIVKLIFNTALSVYLGNAIGISGVTCATVISNCVGVLILITFVIVKNHGFSYRPYLSSKYVRILTLLGLPESSFFISLFILESGVNALALRFYSIRGIAVASVLINLYEIVAFVSEGISEYETVAVNWAIGRKDRESLGYGMKITFRAVIIESIVYSLLFLLAAPFIVEVFDIDDAETVKAAIYTIRIFAVSTFALITARVTAIFNQYTERVGRAILIWIIIIGLVPLLFSALLSGISLEALVSGVAFGPVIAVALMWLLPFGQEQKKAVDLRRTRVVFRDEE